MYYNDYYETTSVDSAAVAAIMMPVLIIGLIMAVLTIVGYWKIFSKAGEAGWASIIPFYNQYILSKITFGNGWLFLLLLIPVVNAIFMIVMMYKLAKAFGHGVGYTIGLIFLPFIFLLIIAFGKSEYQGVE